MPLSDIVSISITSETAGVSQAGFGTPLILAGDCPGGFTERVRTYTDLSGLSADGFSVNGATYKLATRLLAQNPRPDRFMVGRLANKPTQAWDIDLGSAGILNSKKYQLQVVDPTGLTQNAIFTTDGSATEAELWVGLAAAFNTLTGPTVTATSAGGDTHMTLVADVAGTWHGISVLDPDGQYDGGVYMSIVRTEADAGMAADLAAIAAANSDWYAVLSPFSSKAVNAVVSTYCEANRKVFLGDVQDSATVTAAAGGTDQADDAHDGALARTALIYHPDNAAFAAAAWAGRCLPLDPGSETWKFKTLAGVVTYPITPTHQVNLEAKQCNYYYRVAGVNITSQGVVSAGEYIDVIRFRDWLEARLSERVFGVLVNNKKVSYTDRGIALIEAEVRAQLKEGISVGGLTEDPAPTVTIPKASAAAGIDRTARLLRNVKFTATLAGAIHKLTIQGTITA
jgi:hypothetical protein